MTLTPPFSIGGEAGKSLDLGVVPLSVLGVTDAVLDLRSLDVDTLTFSLRDNGSRPAIPDDGQWLTVFDATGQTLFTGIAKRSFAYPAKIYSYEVSNVYKGLMETPLLGDDGRPFLFYIADDLGLRLRDLLIRAANTGLPIQAPEEMPPLYLAPKQAFRAASYAAALEDCCKWAPDLVTRMDYSTNPPTLRFESRAAASARTLVLEADNHKATQIQLTALPEARALGISLSYARRSGDDLVLSLEQQAGDPTAESRRKLSVFLSGVERTDALVSDALTSAQLALIKINELITVTSASMDAVAATAALSLDWATALANDSNLLAATSAESGFTMTPGGYLSYYNNPDSDNGPSQSSYSGTVPYLATAAGAVATGWYAIRNGAFTSGQLATAGATKEIRYMRGEFRNVHVGVTGRTGGQLSLWDNAVSQCTFINGYTQQTSNPQYADFTNWSRAALWYRVNIPVDAINMSPSAVAAAVKAAAAGTSASGFIERAEFVEAPADLAQNYFERQDWTPYKGSVAFAPSVAEIPAPGDFINVSGSGIPAEWATMKVPVAETSIDLATRAATCAIGPSPRQDFQSLIDRLRIPAEDNYQPG